MYTNDDRWSYRVIRVIAEREEEIPDLFRQLAEALEAHRPQAETLHEVTFARDSDRDGWPTWSLSAYLALARLDE